MSPKEPQASGGWIAPDGSFFPCCPEAHEDIAYTLARQFYGLERGSIDLEPRRWLRLFTSGLCRMGDPCWRPNSAQKRALGEISHAFRAAGYIRTAAMIDAEVESNIDAVLEWINR